MSRGTGYGRTFFKYEDKSKPPPHPPVGQYDIAENIGKKKVKWSIFRRLRMFNEFGERVQPASNHYRISENLTRPTRRAASFGFGKKIDLAKPLNHNPGAG
jgi:hypothetical protein